jgi:hypothetical protein
MVAMFLCLAGARIAAAQVDSVRTPSDTLVTHMLRLRDGSVLMGQLLSRDSVSLKFATHGGVLTIPAASVAEIKQITATEIHDNQYWFPDPNRTRLFFAPTGRMLEHGEGYYSNTYLLLQNFASGLTDNFTLGGGFSVIPSSDFLTNNAYYLTPKLGVFNSPKTNVALGALVGFAPFDNGHSFGILYGVATQGGPDANVTGGLGYGYANGKLSSQPIVMLGGESRVSRRVALLTENYFYWSNDNQFTCTTTCQSVSRTKMNAVVSYGLRFMGEKLSTDFAFWNSSTGVVFPGIPYVAFAVKF